MRALFVQHDHVSPTGNVSARLRERGFEVDEVLVVDEPNFNSPNVQFEFPPLDGYDLVVPMGAPWGAWDDARIGNWLLPEIEWVREAVERDIPVFGICFGGQLLAAAHGGSVSRSAAPELGWVEISSDDESLVPGGEWFQWHYDRWEQPDAATELARNASSSQAFILGRNLAVQFHPEMSSAILASWIATGGAEEINKLGITVEELVRQTAQRDASNRERAHRQVDLFLDRVAVQSEVGRG